MCGVPGTRDSAPGRSDLQQVRGEVSARAVAPAASRTAAGARRAQPRKVLRTFLGVSLSRRFAPVKGWPQLSPSRVSPSRGEPRGARSVSPLAPRTRDRRWPARASRPRNLRRRPARQTLRAAHRRWAPSIETVATRELNPCERNPSRAKRYQCRPQNVFGVAAAVEDPLDRFERPTIVDLTAAQAAAISQSPSSNPRI